MNRHTNPFAQGAATGTVLVLLILSYTLVRGAPAAGQAATPQAIVIITATPTIGMVPPAPTADIPVPTAVPLAIEAPTEVPPIAVQPEPSPVEVVPVVQVAVPAPAPPTAVPPAPPEPASAPPPTPGTIVRQPARMVIVRDRAPERQEAP